MLKVTILDKKDVVHCPIRDVVSRVGDKWSILILAVLEDGPTRFNEIMRLIGNISQKVLTRGLRELERDGYVARVVHPVSPPKVEYSLTKQGESLLDPLKSMIYWAEDHHADIRKSRISYDKNVG